MVRHAPEPDRVEFVAELAARWVSLRRTPAKDRRVALLLANYPNRDGRIGNGVGLDTPASAVALIAAMRDAGYGVDGAPAAGDALMRLLAQGQTNDRAHNAGRVWPRNAFIKRPGTVTVRIGPPIESRDQDPKMLNALAEQWIEEQQKALC